MAAHEAICRLSIATSYVHVLGAQNTPSSFGLATCSVVD